MVWKTGIATIVVLALVACGEARKPTGTEPMRVAPDISQRRAQFAPMKLEADLSPLSREDRTALDHLVAAARIMDTAFHRQVWTGNTAFAARVAALDGVKAGPAKEYYRIMFGPWDRLRDSEPFLGDLPHPKGAGYYPEDMTKEAFEAHLAAHPEDTEAFTSTVTVIKRRDGRLVVVPYREEYKDLLDRAAAELRAAAAATTNDSLRDFLTKRAAAFASDDYYESDLAWMDLDSLIEVVIGPYETYEDGLFGYKAAFESFVCVAQPEDSQRLALFKAELPYLEASLPIPDEHKNPARGSESPIRVVDLVFSAGDAKAGVQTVAFNLPNDERVREAKGSKNVLLKNMMRAKHDAILQPIAARVLPEGEAGKVAFEPFFQHVLFHELSHGLGPGRIVVGGRQTEVRKELKELYSAIEEAKADVLGAHALYLLADKGVVPREDVAPLPWTFVAGLFRSARFGTTEAHGLGVVLQTTYLLDKGAIEITADGRFQPVEEKFPGALKDLCHDLLMIEALGDYEGAEAFAAKFGRVSPAMQALLATFSDLPVDVDPVFTYLEGTS